MSITTEGIKAEKQARLWLKDKGVYDIQQFDWFIKKNGKYFIVEVKNRELFEPPPFTGTGLDISQLKRRKQIYEDLGIDTYLLVFVKNSNDIYWQRLSVLEKTKYFDTKNNIRIYNIKEFKSSPNSENKLFQEKT